MGYRSKFGDHVQLQNPSPSALRSLAARDFATIFYDGQHMRKLSRSIYLICSHIDDCGMRARRVIALKRSQ